jgi:hypothetical protein
MMDLNMTTIDSLNMDISNGVSLSTWKPQLNLIHRFCPAILSCCLHHDTNNSAIAIDMTFAMDITRFAPVKDRLLRKTTALFSIETAKQEL